MAEARVGVDENRYYLKPIDFLLREREDDRAEDERARRGFEMADRIEGTIRQIRGVDARTPVLAERGKLEAALLAAPGSYVGARLSGLSASLTLFLADLGVVGANGGLTAHGANVRARLDRQWYAAKMPL